MSKEILLQTAADILARAGFHAEAQWADEHIPRLCITSKENLSALIGKDGLHVGAVEHLIRTMSARKLSYGQSLPDFIVDINDYRKAQTDELVVLARQSAKRVIASGRAESLSPMNGFERKIIHTELAVFEDLETQSIGTEPNRRVVIKRVSL